jgi:DNA polymerase-3 subunit beta
MKLTVERDALFAALSRARKAAASKSSIPILTMLRLDANEDGLTIRATNMEIAYRETVAANIETPGAVCAGVQQLYSIASNAEAGSQIEMAMKESQLHVAAGKARFRLATKPIEDFPAIPDVEGSSAEVDAAPFLAALARCLPAASNEETRYYLCGVHLNETSAGLDVVACDGVVLIRVSIPMPKGLSLGENGVIVPRGTMPAAAEIFGSAELLSVTVSESGLALAMDGRYLRSRLKDGAFPNYERVIPNPVFSITVDVAELRAAVNRLRDFGDADSSWGGFHLGLRLDGDRLKLLARGRDGQMGRDEIAVEGAGRKFDIGMNGKQLLTMLAAIGSETASLGFTSMETNVLFSSTTDKAFTGAIWPIRYEFASIDREAA